MKKQISLFWITMLLLLSTATLANGTFTGLVIDRESKTPIANAKITLNQFDKRIREISTKSDGSFSVSLPVGTYAVEVAAKGYEKSTLSIFIQAKKTTNVEIALTKETILDKTVLHELVNEDLEMYQPFMLRENRKMAIGLPASYSGTMIFNDAEYIDHNTEEYDFINENIFKDALTSPLSTFSIDVDRASYANVRRFLNQSQKPYRDAVRIEELINYFDYSYPQPKDGHPFSVTLEAGECPWNPDHQLVLVGLKGENVNEKLIPPNNLVFLIDVSGSMMPANKLPLLKQAFKLLVNQLRPEDKVAIVVYAGNAGLVLESTPGTNKEKILGAIDRLEAGGSTAGGAGIKLAYKVAQESFIHGGNNRIILASDGDFNVGVSSTSELVKLAEQKRESGVYLSILGFGMGNYKDGRMKQISMAGNGNYAYIDNIMEAKKVFGTELWGTLYTIANDVKIQVEFNPARVKSYRLIGYEKRIMNNEDFNDDKKDAGDIGCGHTVTALYEIQLTDGRNTNPKVDPLIYTKQILSQNEDLLTVKIRYKKPGEDTSNLLTQSMSLGKTHASNNLHFASAVAEFGMLLRESEFKGSASFASALTRAKNSKLSDEYGYKTDFIKLIELAEMIYK